MTYSLKVQVSRKIDKYLSLMSSSAVLLYNMKLSFGPGSFRAQPINSSSSLSLHCFSPTQLILGMPPYKTDFLQSPTGDFLLFRPSVRSRPSGSNSWNISFVTPGSVPKVHESIFSLTLVKPSVGVLLVLILI